MATVSNLNADPHSDSISWVLQLLLHNVCRVLLHQCSSVSMTKCWCYWWFERGSMNAAQIECKCVNENIAIARKWLSKCYKNFVACIQHVVVKMFFENVLHECRGSGWFLNIEALGTSVQKFIGPNRKYLKLQQKQSIFQTLAVIVEYWKYWMWNSVPYTEGLCSHLQVFWQASSPQTWMKNWHR